MSNIVIVSGHYPNDTYYSMKTKEIMQNYALLHKYDFYYDEDAPCETYMSSLHFMRCESIRKASIKYPDAKWFIWVDSDVYVNFRHENLPIENFIDLSNESILYHLFHESPWNTFPYEQKTLYEHILPKLNNDEYIIHDPYTLNCIIKAYPNKIKNALLIHMCAMTTEERNNYIDLRNKYASIGCCDKEMYQK